MLNQFSQFLVDNLFKWLNSEIYPGYRYRFYSDNSKNLLSIIDILKSKQTAIIKFENIELPYISINNCNLIFVNDVEGEMNENFISNLRDTITSQVKPFENTALLVLHKTKLDTILNSAKDLSDKSCPFHPSSVKDFIRNIISESSLKNVFEELMDIQTKIILEQRQSAFGYEKLFNTVKNDEILFDDFNLFKDADLIKEPDSKKIKNRLEKNQKLYDEIETTMINFPTEAEDRLTKYSEEFISKYITHDNWKDVTYNKLINEINTNKGTSISFLNLDVENSTYTEPKNERDSVPGRRTKNIIIFSDEDIIKVFFKFKGDGLKTDLFKIKDNKELEKSINLNYIGISRTLEIDIPNNDDKPKYFRLVLNGKKASDKYTFKILVLKEDSFYLKNIYSHFILQPNKKRILLQLNDKRINFSPNNVTEYILKENECININETPYLNVEGLYNSQDEVKFTITNEVETLDFIVEGKKIDKVISIPLIYNQNRLNKIFANAVNSQLNHDGKKAILENSEFPLIAKRFTYIDYEYQIINDTSTLEIIKNINEPIYNSLINIFEYFKKNNTVPSLCAWDNEISDLAEKFILLIKEYLENIPTNTSLSNNQKEIYNIGKKTIDGKIYLTPFSPLILSYILYLKKQTLNDVTFEEISEITLTRLNPKGLFPYLYKDSDSYAYTRNVSDDPLWLEFVPFEDSEFSYVSKLTSEKIIEFTKTFEKLFEFRNDAPLIINSINNSTNIELFKGLVDYYKKTYDKNPKKIVVNLFDDHFHETEFDVFADIDQYEELQKRYKLDINTESIIDVMRTHITYSKHIIKKDKELLYSHISFFKNNEKVEIRPNKVNLQKSGLVCEGLVSGESSEEKNGYYYSGFGLENINIENNELLQIAKLYNALQRSVIEQGSLYDEEESISLMISDNFKNLLEKSYENSLWTVIIDPKVTLDFFDNQKDLILIHYSDQYSSSANYDAITVTNKKDLYANVVGNETIIREFNAFNGEWLMKMISDKQEKNKKEKIGVIAAYKYITSLVDIPEIVWVPLSVAELVRVSGNVGLNMSQGDFTRYNHNLSKEEEKEKHIGPISDDILLAGFCEDGLILYPVEVKSGSADMTKANKQAKALKKYFYDNLFNGYGFKSRLLKGLFIRQIFMQVEKYKLYEVFHNDYFKPLENKREELLQGRYSLLEFNNFNEGAVIFFNQSQTQFDPNFEIVNEILECKLPYSYQQEILEESYKELRAKMLNEEFGTNLSYMLKTLDYSIYNKSEIKDLKEIIKEEKKHEIILEKEHDENLDKKIENSIEPLKVKFGIDVKTKDDIIWFPTDTKKTLNTNTGIIGTMGTGKTQFTMSLISQLLQNEHNNLDSLPIDILILNYNVDDYTDKDFVKRTNAKVFEAFHLPFNPLSLFGSRPLQPVHTANLFKTTLSKVFGLGQVQQSNLNRIIMEAYELKGIDKNDRATWSKPAPTIYDLWDIYSNEEKVVYDSLYAALEKLTSFEIFEPNSNNTKPLFEILDGMTVIDVAGNDTDIQKLVVAITLDIFYAQMQTQGTSKKAHGLRQITKMLLVDEADNFMSENFISLKKILKEGRKYGIGTILSTQQLSHFKTTDNDYTEYILSWVIHKVDKIKSQDINSIFNISNKFEIENLMDQIRQLEEHHSIYVDGKKNMMKMRDLAFWELIKERELNND